MATQHVTTSSTHPPRALGPPLKASALLTFEDAAIEQGFDSFYTVQTLTTACAATAIVIVGGSTLCLKAVTHDWDTKARVLLLDSPIIALACFTALLIRYHHPLFLRLKFYLFATFKVYGSAHANYICAALLPYKITSALSFATHISFLSPLTGLAFYCLGYFLPFRKAILLHVVATALAFWCNRVYCPLSMQAPPAADLVVWCHDSFSTLADLIWCGLKLPGRSAGHNPVLACSHLLDLLCLVMGFAWINTTMYVSELKARVKYANTVSGRRGVEIMGYVITHQGVHSFTAYLTAGLIHFGGLSWYAICFFSD